MTYADAVDRLLQLPAELHSVPGQQRRKFDLEHMRRLLAALGNPERAFRSILIAGTNGKGSTASMLASVVGAAGYKVGLYTSPHLERVNERIQFVSRGESANIDDDAFARLAMRVQGAGARLVAEGSLPWTPSFFETVTAIGMLAFAETAVDLAVLEVGMGGRLDATNVVEPLFSIITDISLDHTEWLGPTIREIATEKAGILRHGGVLVTLPQHPDANQAIGEIAMRLGIRGVNAAEYMPFGVGAPRGSVVEDGSHYSVSVLSEQLCIKPALGGQHQRRNIALVLAAAVELKARHGFDVGTDQIAAGIAQTRWPGRLERIRKAGEPDVILDAAHNAAGAWALRASLSDLQVDSADSTLIFSCFEDKAIEEMGSILFPIFSRVFLTRVQSPRAAATERLVLAAQSTGVQFEVFEKPEAALETALQKTRKEGLVVVAGSVYLVGQLRAKLI